MHQNEKILEILSKLETENLSYAVITGKFEEDGTAYEQTTSALKPDLDIVFFSITKSELHRKLIEIGLEHVHSNSYRYKSQNNKALPIDIYIEYINAGYYYLFPIDSKKIRRKNCRNEICEEDYILYQLIEPLIKFSGYKKRHLYRINKYLENGYITPEIKQRLYSIIGQYFADKILKNIQEKTPINRITVKMIKMRLLFKHGNFFRMINQRIFQHEQ